MPFSHLFSYRLFWFQFQMEFLLLIGVILLNSFELNMFSSPILYWQKVVQISCGWRHTLAVTDKQNVYSWGRGTNGQLGHRESIDRYQTFYFWMMSQDISFSCYDFPAGIMRKSYANDGIIFSWKSQKHPKDHRGFECGRVERATDRVLKHWSVNRYPHTY